MRGVGKRGIRSLPHVRGGVSVGSVKVLGCLTSSPRPWGCFLPICRLTLNCNVFPTSVGVFLLHAFVRYRAARLPHVRGGVSDGGVTCQIIVLSSPRPWGCFRRDTWVPFCVNVFPTSVGVFPSESASNLMPQCLPHVRGGVSAPPLPTRIRGRSSPRPWGCFSIKSSD